MEDVTWCDDAEVTLNPSLSGGEFEVWDLSLQGSLSSVSISIDFDPPANSESYVSDLAFALVAPDGYSVGVEGYNVSLTSIGFPLDIASIYLSGWSTDAPGTYSIVLSFGGLIEGSGLWTLVLLNSYDQSPPVDYGVTIQMTLLRVSQEIGTEYGIDVHVVQSFVSTAGEAADGVADEAQGGEADGGGHAADLAVLALVDLQLNPRGRDVGAVPYGRRALPRWRVVRQQAGLGGAGGEDLALGLEWHGARGRGGLPLRGRLRPGRGRSSRFCGLCGLRGCGASSRCRRSEGVGLPSPGRGGQRGRRLWESHPTPTSRGGQLRR